MTRLLRAASRDHESIITMLSNAMQEEQENSNSYDIMNDLHEETYDEFDEQPVKVSLVRSKSRVLSKTDFCCVHDHVIRCVCANIIAHIDTTEKSGYVPPDDYQVFNKEGGSLDYSLDTVSFILSTVHRDSLMEFECIVIALIYLERIPRLTNQRLRICALNWRYLLFTCMMLSSKIWDDLSMINADYATIFSNLSLEKINLMEIHLLKIFNFYVEINLQEYEKMNQTIQDLNHAASRMHLKITSPLHSPHHTEAHGVSISGRQAFNRPQILHNLEDNCSDECQMPPTTQSLAAGYFSEDAASPTEKISARLSTRPNSFSSYDPLDLNCQSVRHPDVIVEHPDNRSEESGEDEKQNTRKQRTAIQAAVDNALGILVKYLPTHHPTKVFVTNEDPH